MRTTIAILGAALLAACSSTPEAPQNRAARCVVEDAPIGSNISRRSNCAPAQKAAGSGTATPAPTQTR